MTFKTKTVVANVVGFTSVCGLPWVTVEHESYCITIRSNGKESIGDKLTLPEKLFKSNLK